MGGKQEGISRRLSKPRTNNNSSSNLLNIHNQTLQSSSPLTPSETDYFGDATVVNSQGERRSRRKSRSRLRAYLYGTPSESSHVLSSDEEDEKCSPSFLGATCGSNKRLSRSYSSFLQLSSARASTPHLSNSSKQLLVTDAEESAIVAEQVKERAHRDRLAAQNHITPPVDEDEHVDFLLAPVRRKSLYTPGIATRNARDILQKPPPPKGSLSAVSQADLDYYYNPKHSDTSPLARLAALNVPEDGRGTPSDINIPHLGGLKLGTLRVTNGVASPIPQTSKPINRCLPPTPSSSDQKESHKASKSCTNEELSVPSKAKQQHVDVAISPPTTSSSISNNEMEELDAQGRLVWQFSANCKSRYPGCASFPAHTYRAELAGSPFPQSSSAKETDLGAEMFDDEAVVIQGLQQSESDRWRSWITEAAAHQTGKGSREDALEKLNGNTECTFQSRRLSVPLSLNSQFSGAIDTTLRADSGYNSNDSLDANQRPNLITRRTMASTQDHDDKSLGSPPQVRSSFTTAQREANVVVRPKSGSIGTKDVLETTSSSIRSSSQHLVRKLQKSRPKSQPPSLQLINSTGFHQSPELPIPRVPSFMAAKHAQRLTQFPLLEHTFPSCEHVTASNSTTSTEFKSVPVRFPSPANAFEPASAAFAVDYELHEQAGSRDGLPLARSQKGPSATENEDQWSFSGIVRSPSWSTFGRSKKERAPKRLTKRQKGEEPLLIKEEQDSVRTLRKDKAALKKQLVKGDRSTKIFSPFTSSRMRGKSAERRLSQQEAVTAIADFGNVAESLGGSPYDIAASIHPNALRDARSCRPYQLTSATQMPNSFVGRLGMGQTQQCSTGRSFGRPTISAQEIWGDLQAIPARRARPQTMLPDVPPVPALSAIDIRAHNLEWARSRHRSLANSAGKEIVRNGPHIKAGPAFDDHGGGQHRVVQPQSMALDNPRVSERSCNETTELQEAKIVEHGQQEKIVDGESRDIGRIDGSKGPIQSRSQAKTLTSHEAKASNITVPDLWSNSSLEMKNLERETLETTASDWTTDDKLAAPFDNSNMWEAQRHAWSERRKSAGEALRNQKRTNDVCIDSGLEQPSTPQQQASQTRVECYPDAITPAASLPWIRVTHSQHPNSSEPGKLTQKFVPSYCIPANSVGSGTSISPIATISPSAENHVFRVTGRYEGGLQYNYEPGCGLGGSAGTRGAKTEASRKSVEVSKGFGVDLSDVPVFVATAPW